MLVVTRQRDESVVLRDRDGMLLGQVTIVDGRGAKVRVGFTFPREIIVDRDEVDRAKQREQEAKS